MCRGVGGGTRAKFSRLVPVLAVVIGFESTWFVHVSKGPYWDFFVGEEYRNCRSNWWTNILFINNYVASDNMVFININTAKKLFIYCNKL